ncbi:MAG: PrsW family intramembrane metalloprotease [Anaerolineales bacterium]|nr:PrsW family intramembrane metalloprotease [Anaerolineales bacterium]
MGRFIYPVEILLGLFLCFLFGLMPAAIYGWFVDWLDQHEKEPWWLLALAFGWGAVPAIILALITQIVLDIPTTWVFSGEGLAYEVVGGSVWAPLTEELAKGLGLVLILLVAHREVDNVLDGIVYGAMAGLGFAFTENLFYFGGALIEGGWGNWAFVVLLRTIPFGLNHAFFSGVTGAGLALAYLSRNLLVRVCSLVGGFVTSVIFHGLHNLGATLAGASCVTLCLSLIVDWGGILMLGVVIGLIWRQEKSWIVRQLSGEVTAEVYEILTSWSRWQGSRWEALLRGDLAAWRHLGRLRKAATELAFSKQRLAQQSDDQATQQDIARYRRQLAELGAVPL